MARLDRLAFDPSWRVAWRRFGRLQLEFDKSSWQGRRNPRWTHCKYVPICPKDLVIFSKCIYIYIYLNLNINLNTNLNIDK